MSKEIEKKTVVVEEEAKALTLEERHAEIMDIIGKVNKAAIDNDLAAVNSNKALLNEAIGTYNQQLREAEYEKWLATENPVLSAITQGTINQVAAKNKKVDEGTPAQIELGSKCVVVDLVELNDFAGLSRKIFVSGQWIHKIDALKVSLTERVAADLENKEIKSAVAGTIKLSSAEGKEAAANRIANPTSNASLKKACQEIIDDILEGFTFRGKDLQFIFKGMTKISNKKIGDIVAPRKDTVIKLITIALHVIVTKKEYGVDYEITK